MKTVKIIKTTYVEFDDDEYEQLKEDGQLESESQWRAHGMDDELDIEYEDEEDGYF